MTSTTLKPSQSSRFSIPFRFKAVIRSCFCRIKFEDRARAVLICNLIPAQCPFARDISLFGQTLFTIPPLCKINPVYDELMELRFRALSYLADQCGEDINQYCQ